MGVDSRQRICRRERKGQMLKDVAEERSRYCWPLHLSDELLLFQVHYHRLQVTQLILIMMSAPQ